MTDKLRIALAQLNPTVGDVAGNLKKAIAARREASLGGADLIVFSELFLAGYPPEDLVLKPAFQRAITQARSEEHTSELQSLMRISYAVFCLKKKNNITI